ncbi:hypothetical protein BDR06DRAFT_888887 [Suillus hirtellus]|nr:hypothetical protein BDR06DRAFT_888887 [Suillus hirtellus]
MFLCTGHAPLNAHLHRIRKSATPFCSNCLNVEENIHHYLFVCPMYQHACHQLSNALGHQATSLPYILTDPAATPHLIKYINTTGCMKAILGEIPLPRTPAS